MKIRQTSRYYTCPQNNILTWAVISDMSAQILLSTFLKKLGLNMTEKNMMMYINNNILTGLWINWSTKKNDDKKDYCKMASLHPVWLLLLDVTIYIHTCTIELAQQNHTKHTTAPILYRSNIIKTYRQKNCSFEKPGGSRFVLSLQPYR